MRFKPVILTIMDGWGLAPASETNAVSSANTPIFDELCASYRYATLDASGPAVGLPVGQPGNSEVGHMNIGAGRVVMQDLPRIHDAIASGAFQDIPALADFITALRATGGKAHLIGLFSRGGVHAHTDHQRAMIHILQQAGIEVVLHLYTDGRDTLPRLALSEWEAFASQLDQPVTVGTVIGRYYAMDRDKRWERTKAAFDAMVKAVGVRQAASVPDAIAQGYEAGEGDEFIQATIIDGYRGMADGDGIFMSNFRVDRARQIFTAFLDPGEVGIPDSDVPALGPLLSMTPVFSPTAAPSYLFGPQDLSHGLGEVVAEAGLRQLRLAETEKYPHVTYFFNGGNEVAFGQEDRLVVPSPKVATYDLQPEMSADDVLGAALKAVRDETHDLIIINFANPDMVGHTGDVAAARHAVETVDAAVGELREAVEAKGGAMIVTADHGNCEVMWDDEAKSPHTAHTTNLVPVILVGGAESTRLSDGVLADLAPTLCVLLGISQPAEMTGKSLLK